MASESYTYDQLVDLLHQLDDELDASGFKGKIDIHPVGGFPMLHYGLRSKSPRTKDIDCASPDFGPEVHSALKRVSERNGISTHWLNNDTVMAFESGKGSPVTEDDVHIANMMMRAEYLPDEFGMKHISVHMPTIETLAYSKAVAACDVFAAERGAKDFRDMLEIFEHEGASTYKQALRRFPELANPEFEPLEALMEDAQAARSEATWVLKRNKVRDELLDSYDDIDLDHVDDWPEDDWF